jgi:AcrR family transcriptional regulator
MARPSLVAQRRREFAPVLADAFAELGYRRATTAELAQRCGLAENVLYRLWPDKRAMFVAAVEHVFAASEADWSRITAEDADESTAERLLEHEAAHHGDQGLHRIIFAGLSETDDPEIAAALQRVFRSFHRFVKQQISGHRAPGVGDDAPSADLAAWALIGLGTVAGIGRDLGLMGDRRRKKLFREVGQVLLGE